MTGCLRWEFRSVGRPSGMYGPPPFCKRKARMTELACANVFGLYWSSELLACMGCAALSSLLVTLPLKAFSGYRLSRAPGSTVVPSHVFRQQTWQEFQNSDQSSLGCRCGNRFSDFQAWRFVPGVMCRPSGCLHLCYCWRAKSLSFEQHRPGHARHLVGQRYGCHLLALAGCEINQPCAQAGRLSASAAARCAPPARRVSADICFLVCWCR